MKTFFAAILLLMTTHCVITQKSHQPTLENTDHSKMQKQIYSSMRELDSMNARINDGYK